MTTKWLLSSTTALALIATPALAQKNPASSGSPKSQQETNNAIDKAVSERNAGSSNRSAEQSDDQASSDNSADQSASNQSANNPHRNVRAMTQQRMRAALEEAGFTQIRVLDAKYLIQAKDDDGNTVFMSVNPPSMDRAAISRAETTGSGSSDRRSGSPRGNINESASGSGSSRGSGPWNSQSAYNNSAYDQGFRDGYNRGYDNGAGYGYGR